MQVKGTYSVGKQKRVSSGVSHPTPVALIHPYVSPLVIEESRKKRLFSEESQGRLCGGSGM